MRLGLVAIFLAASFILGSVSINSSDERGYRTAAQQDFSPANKNSQDQIRPITQPGGPAQLCNDEITRPIINTLLPVLHNYRLITEDHLLQIVTATTTYPVDVTIPIHGRDQVVRLNNVTSEFRGGTFSILDRSLSGVTPASGPDTENIVLRGHIVEDDKADLNSLVVLYVRPEITSDGRSLDPYMTGFVLEDLNNPGAAPWHFIEPLRPLLFPQATRPAGNPLRPDVAPGESEDLPAVDQIEQCFPNGVHISYVSFPPDSTTPPQNINVSDINPFRIDLDARGLDANLFDRSDAQDKVKELAAIGLKQPLNLVGVGDAALWFLYNDIINNEKLWWEGLEEVLVPVISLFQTKIPEFDLRTRSLEIWRSRTDSPGGPIAGVSAASAGATGFGTRDSDGDNFVDDLNGDGELEINVYELLCDFAQGIVPEMLDKDSTTPLNARSSSDHIDPGIGAVHLFTGYDLGVMPDKEEDEETAIAIAIADSGGGFCQEGCGGNGRDILGIAESIGGLESSNSTGCSKSLEALAENASLFAPAHHSVSQQFPETPDELFFGGGVCPSGCSADCCSANFNYNAILLQRFLIVAHEIGHNFGFRHVEDAGSKSIMHTPLTQDTRFILHDF